MIIPPNAGMAMGTIISAPLPVDESTGNRAITATAVVIMAGRTRFRPAATTASRTSLTDDGMTFFKYLVNVCTHNNPVVRGNSEQGNESYPDRHTQVYRVHLEHIPQVYSGY